MVVNDVLRVYDWNRPIEIVDDEAPRERRLLYAGPVGEMPRGVLLCVRWMRVTGMVASRDGLHLRAVLSEKKRRKKNANVGCL